MLCSFVMRWRESTWSFHLYLCEYQRTVGYPDLVLAQKDTDAQHKYFSLLLHFYFALFFLFLPSFDRLFPTFIPPLFTHKLLIFCLFYCVSCCPFRIKHYGTVSFSYFSSNRPSLTFCPLVTSIYSLSWRLMTVTDLPSSTKILLTKWNWLQSTSAPDLPPTQLLISCVSEFEVVRCWIFLVG